MKVSTDNKQRLITSVLFLSEIYRILMGTCLSVFVPHQCGQETCSVKYNVIDNDTILHRATLGINLVSLLIFLTLYGFELHRENWCIKHLDMDKTKSPINLDTEIEYYPEIKSTMKTLNKKYKTMTIICSASQVINISVSIADIAYAWAGFTSLTPLLSYVLLIALKLSQTYSIAEKSLRKERALSAYIKSSKIYNTIDTDFRIADIPTLYTNTTYKH